MAFGPHLGEHRLGDVVVAAPICRTLGIGELIEIMPVAFRGKAFRFGIHGRAMIDEVAFTAIELDE